MFLKSFTIKNYKSIANLEIEKLNRVNLFIGDNNAGKSNILEAVLLYATRFNLTHILSVNKHRMEPSILNPENVTSRGICLPLVRNRSIIIFKEGIELRSSTESVKLQLVKAIRVNKGGEILTKYRPFNQEEEGINAIKVGISDDSKNYEYRSISKVPINAFPCIYVNCASKQLDKWTEYWENIVLTDDKSKILGALQIIAPEIEDIAVIRMLEDSPKPFVKIGEHKSPLFAMGDGIVHIFNIMLALINAKDGILLLDEMENGLHLRTLEKLWTVINNLSKQWNVQVFVTTHSNDCIKAFSENSREDGTLYIIKHQNGETSLKTKNFKMVETSLKANIDLRDYTNADKSDEGEDDE